MGDMTAIDVGIEPMMRVASSRYAQLALANEIHTIEAARRAAANARSTATRSASVTMLREHEASMRGLAAIPTAAGQLRSASASASQYDAVLRQAPADRFAELQLDLRRYAWALHSGYAADGADPALRRFAGSAVLQAERDLRLLSMRPKQY